MYGERTVRGGRGFGREEGGKVGKRGEREGDLEKVIYVLPYITRTVYADSNLWTCIQ